jgi:hypothetical protein
VSAKPSLRDVCCYVAWLLCAIWVLLCTPRLTGGVCGAGGETEFLRSVDGGGGGGRHAEDNVLWSVRPQQGSILIFPHDTPHQGAGVGSKSKIILRGDWCAARLTSGRLPGWSPYMPAALCSICAPSEDACAPGTNRARACAPTG